MSTTRRLPTLVLGALLVTGTASARQNIRSAFFEVYPDAADSRIAVRADQTEHCGVCHYDFAGGGARNPYGQALELVLPDFPSNPNGRRQAVAFIEGIDAEPDGFSTLTEVTDLAGFVNTPTFPGLTAGNVNQVSNIELDYILDYLTPSDGDSDTEPPAVAVIFPAGGERFASSSEQLILWDATDDSGTVTSVDILVAFGADEEFEPLARGIANSGTFTWFVQNRPTGAARIEVRALDPSGNEGSDASDPFEIYSAAAGRVPTTLRDFDMPGTQPLGAAALSDPVSCAGCHSGYGQQEIEPQFNWEGSMMAQASIDPLFLAALEVANQDAPESGDLCLRCHTSAGWLGGRSTPTDGFALLDADRTGVNCDVCHRMVDPIYDSANPAVDFDILADLEHLPEHFTSGQYVVDPSAANRRGPFSDTVAPHTVLVSPFHREAAFCGTCHDVSNPVFVRNPDGTYVPNAFDDAAEHFGSHEIGSVERTYSEWFYSAFNTPEGVYAPDLGGNRDYVASCQDCHMRDVTGQGCNDPGAPVRNDLPLHDFTGGSAWMAEALAATDPTVNADALLAAAERARTLLQLAAELDAAQDAGTLEVTVTNRAGHKLPTGYPEGRRMWLNVRFYDDDGALLGASGAYDAATGELHEDPALKVYEAVPVIGDNIADVVGLPAGTEFHFALNNRFAKDNRIPPLGFTNADYAAFGGGVVGAEYADGQNYDVTPYDIPAGAARADVRLFYQSVSKAFAEFLRDNAGDAGQTFYDLWVAQGRAAPELMAEIEVQLGGACADPCADADLDGDCAVGLGDLAILLANFGDTGAGFEEGDLDGDGTVGLADLSVLLGLFGLSC